MIAAARGSIVSLPILLFDERVLSPRFGYVFHRRWLDPFESIVGMLWKFARMNRLPGHAVVAQLSSREIDPYEGIAPRDIDVRGVAGLLGVTQRSVRAGLSCLVSDVSRCVRYCPRCIALGYHGALHQLERYVNCPAHGIAIQAACRHCARASAYWLDAQLLDAPFRCRHCRRYYTASGIAPSTKPPALALSERVAVTRAVLS